MLSIQNRSGRDLSVREVNCQGKSVRGMRFPSNILLLALVLIFLMGCTVSINDEVPVTSTVAATVSVPAIRETVTNVATVPTLTPTPTATAMVPPTVTAITHSGDESPTSTPEPGPTLDEPINWENEQLITFRPDGIYRIALDTEKAEAIITRKDKWQLFYAKPSYDGKEIIYWFVEDGMYQVWVVNAIDGDARQLLSTVDDGFTRANGYWLGQDRFFELGIWGEDENGVPLVVQWYLFDISQRKIIGTADDNPGTKVCHTLAISPESSQVATWCSFDSQFEEQHEYTVIEANGEFWQTTTPPEQVLVETFGIDARHIWSPDGNHVLIPSGSNATLVYVPEPQAYQLFENDDIYINPYLARFSPDSKFLSYEYDVCESINNRVDGCLKLMELASGEVVWESTGLYSPPVFISGWSPDSKFFVLSTFEDGDFIFRLRDFSIVKSFSDRLVTTIESAWLEQ